MCNNKCNQKNILIFRNSNPCGCCSETTSSSPGDGIDLPSGGSNGDILVKQGEGLRWEESAIIPSLQSIIIDITSDNQTQFVNAIPEEKSILNLFIEGFKQDLTLDYTITGRTINWVNADFPLKEVYRLSINVY